MRPIYQYGVPIVGGVGTSIRAAREDENIGPVALAGAAGAAGAYGGMMGARKLGPALAGRIAPFLSDAGAKVAPVLKDYGRNRRGTTAVVGEGKTVTKDKVVPKKAPMGGLSERLGEALEDKAGIKALMSDPQVARGLGMTTAAVTIPAGALAAGLGGVAAGKVPGAFGIPGFVDPESYGSSNSPGARYKQTTMNYI